MSKPIKDVTEKDDFVRVDPSHANGTSWRGALRVATADLVARFGKPEDGDGYKTSGEYTFRRQDPEWLSDLSDRNGWSDGVFTIYDWKATELYDRGYTSVDVFWMSDQPYDFNVGGSDPVTVALAEDFTKWVLAEVAQ